MLLNYGNEGLEKTWADHMARAFAGKRGNRVSKLLDPNAVFNALRGRELMSTTAFEAYCMRYAKGPFKYSGGTLKAVLVFIFKIVVELGRPTPSFSMIVSTGISALNAWIDLYRSQEARPFNWMVPGLVTLLTYLDHSGVQADSQQDLATLDVGDDDTGDGDEKTGSGALQQTQNQQRVLNAIRQNIGKFRGDDDRQAGYVVLMSESIQACMTLGNIQMASAFLKTVESSALDVSRIPRDPLVSFKYYLGKLYMQQEKFQRAEEALAWSFSNCPDTKSEMKARIVECLIAVRLRMGKLPPVQLIEKYNLHHYKDIVRAMRTGNIQLFEDVLARETQQLIDEGTLLCVEKLKFIVYRTLFQRTLEWAKTNLFEPGKPTNVVGLDVFTAAFQWQIQDVGIPFDNEEMACIIANLIKLGYIKGYIAWEHGKIVLSKQTPLPPLRSIQIT